MSRQRQRIGVDSSGLTSNESALIKRVFSDRKPHPGADQRSYALSQKVRLFILQGQMMYGALDEEVREDVVSSMVDNFVEGVVDSQIDQKFKSGDDKDKVKEIIRESLFDSIASIGDSERGVGEVTEIYGLLQKEHILQILRKRTTGDGAMASRGVARQEASLATLSEVFTAISSDEDARMAYSERIETALRNFTYKELNEKLTADLLRYVSPSDKVHCKPILETLNKEATSSAFLGNPSVDWGTIGHNVGMTTFLGLVMGFAGGVATDNGFVPVLSESSQVVDFEYGDGTTRMATTVSMGAMAFLGSAISCMGQDCPMKIPGSESSYTKRIKEVHEQINSRLRFRVNFQDRTSVDDSNPEPRVYVSTVDTVSHRRREPELKRSEEESEDGYIRRGPKVKTRGANCLGEENEEAQLNDPEQGPRVLFNEIMFDRVKGFIKDGDLQGRFQNAHDNAESIDGDRLKYIDRERGVVELKVRGSRARMLGYVTSEDNNMVVNLCKFVRTGLHTGSARHNRLIDSVCEIQRREQMGAVGSEIVSASSRSLVDRSPRIE